MIQQVVWPPPGGSDAVYPAGVQYPNFIVLCTAS